MADTIHNVTIKATLDTSTHERTSSRSGSTSGGGSHNLSSSMSLAGATFVKIVEIARNSIAGLLFRLAEIGVTLRSLNYAYVQTHKFVEKETTALMTFGENINKLNRVSCIALNNTLQSLNELQYGLKITAENIEKND